MSGTQKPVAHGAGVRWLLQRERERERHGTEQVPREVNDWRDDGSGGDVDGEGEKRFSE